MVSNLIPNRYQSAPSASPAPAQYSSLLPCLLSSLALFASPCRAAWRVHPSFPPRDETVPCGAALGSLHLNDIAVFSRRRFTAHVGRTWSTVGASHYPSVSRARARHPLSILREKFDGWTVFWANCTGPCAWTNPTFHIASTSFGPNPPPIILPARSNGNVARHPINGSSSVRAWS